jgi:hypothetical protein
MLFLATAFTLATLPTIVMAQPSWSQTNPGTQTSTPQANADRPSAAALGKPLEVNCKPTANRTEEKFSLCAGWGGDDEPSQMTPTRSRMQMVSPLCQVVFNNNDWKTTCSILQF